MENNDTMEENVPEKEIDEEEEEEEEEVKDKKDKKEEEISSDSEYESYDSSSTESTSSCLSTDSNNEKNETEILKSLLLLNKLKKKKEKEKKKEFLPDVKKYLKADMQKKQKLLKPGLIKKLQFLAKNILNRKIPVKISSENKHILKKFVQNKIKENDMKVLLTEDVRVVHEFEKAYKLIEKSKKQ